MLTIIENPAMGGMARRDHACFTTAPERAIDDAIDSLKYFDSHPLVDEARKLLKEGRELVSAYIDLKLKEAAEK